MGRSGSALETLALHAGVDLGEAERDEHIRWRLLSASLADSSKHDLVLRAVRDEEVVEVAAALVVQALELVDRGAGRSEWIPSLPPINRRYPMRRLEELELLDDLKSGNRDDRLVQLLLNSSNWLQLRAVEAIQNPVITEALAQNGRTRRIRNKARENARQAQEPITPGAG